MSQSNPTPQKRIDDRNTDTSQPYATRDVALIDADTIRRLEDEHSDDPGCRFAAVARSLEQTRDRETGVKLPCTRVAYVDASGQYAIERAFFGYREDWNEIPRTAVVTDESVVRTLPESHRETYAPILEQYAEILEHE